MLLTANKDFIIGDVEYHWRIHVREVNADMFFHLRHAIGQWKDMGNYFFFTDLTDAMNFRIIMDEYLVEIHQSKSYAEKKSRPIEEEEEEEIVFVGMVTDLPEVE